jgi:hypothetical protein
MLDELVKDIQTAKNEHGIEILSVFDIPDSYIQDIFKWVVDDANLDLKKLEEYLDYAGRKSEIYLTLLKHYENEIERFDRESKTVIDDIYPSEEWRDLLEAGFDATNLAGYLTLLQMDALTSLISIVKASSNTERIMLSKHAYTIMYEALENNLYQIVSNRMRKFPDNLIDKEVLSDLWKGIKSLSKLLIKKSEAEVIRNTIDSHQRGSFSEQIDSYKKCDFGMSVKSMWALVRIVDLIQSCMNLINKNITVRFNDCGKEWEKRTKVLEDIAKELRDLKNENR